MSVAASIHTMLTVRALAVVNEERNTHGLRYNDYGRYRKHCARKVHRLRQVLKITHGKGKEFKKPASPSVESLQDGHLMLLLLEAERAWAYAQELLNENVKAQDGTLRRRALSRFRTALSWSKQLREHCLTLYESSPSRLSPTSYAEVIAYSLLLHGRFLRTKDDFDPAVKELSVCHAILDQLASSANSSRDQALYTVFSDEIAPEIRYCAHELGRDKAYDINAIVAELAPKYMQPIVPGGAALLAILKSSVASGSGKEQNLDPVLWEGRPVPIRSPELVDAVLRVQKAVRTLDGDRKNQGGKAAAASEGKDGSQKQTRSHHTSRGQLAAFDGVLSALSDAEDLAKKLIESQQGTASRSSIGPEARDATFVHEYISYQLLARRIQRDLLIVHGLLAPPAGTNVRVSAAVADRKMATPQTDPRVYPAVIKTLDTVLQSLDQMRTLSITDESTNIASALDVRISYTKAKRCSYLALAHASAKNYAQAVALGQRGQLHLREAGTFDDPTHASITEIFFYPLDPRSDLIALSKTLDDDSLRFKRDWYAHNGGIIDSETQTAKKTKKPLFFDVAFNYIEPSIDQLRQRAGKAPLKAVEAAPARTAPPPASSAPGARSKVDVEDEDEEVEDKSPPAPAASTSGGLSGLLGSWWGRK